MENELFTDPRDGQTYKTVKIGEQIWMAENMRYKGVEHFAPNGDENNTAKYGCLYTWENAMKACPKGWRLPSGKDIKALLNYVADNKTADSRFLALIANSTDWQNYSNQGIDEFDFGALPAGFYHGGNYGDFGTYAQFWSSSVLSSSRAYNILMGDGKAFISDNLRDVGFPIRCCRNHEVTTKGKQKTAKNIQYTVDIEYGDADYTTTEVFVLSETDRNFLEAVLKDLENDYYIFTTGNPDFYGFEWTAEDIRHLLQDGCYEYFKVKTKKTSHKHGDIKGGGFIYDQLSDFCWEEYENEKFDDNLEGLFIKSSFFNI